MTRPTLLIADSNRRFRQSLRRRFISDGYGVVEAGTAAAAIARIEKGVDLVLVDDRLWDQDGLPVLRRIKELTSDTAVVVMTAVSTVDDAIAALKHGPYHCLVKPVDLDDAVLTVARALETERLRRELRADCRSHSHDVGADTTTASSRTAARAVFQLPPAGVRLEDVERQLVEQALERTGGNQTHAGRLLGLNRDQIRYRIEKFGLTKSRPFSPWPTARRSETAGMSPPP